MFGALGLTEAFSSNYAVLSPCRRYYFNARLRAIILFMRLGRSDVHFEVAFVKFLKYLFLFYARTTL